MSQDEHGLAWIDLPEPKLNSKAGQQSKAISERPQVTTYRDSEKTNRRAEATMNEGRKSRSRRLSNRYVDLVSRPCGEGEVSTHPAPMSFHQASTLAL